MESIEPNNHSSHDKQDENLEEKMFNHNVAILMRQTDYSREKATEKLKELKTIEACIEDYLGISRKNKVNPISTNQAIYKSIREWMK
jgi:hypothetical protein